MVVFDVTNKKTFQAVPKWKADIDENLQNIPVVLLANKVQMISQSSTFLIHLCFIFFFRLI
jgi:GTPase SAR1 family protein